MHELDQTVPLTSIDPRMRYFFALSALILALAPLLPLLIWIKKTGFGVWLVPVYLALAAVLAYRYGKAAHARFGYGLVDDGLWLQTGVAWRKAIFVPRERIQHTEVSHGPLDRHLGLAKLVVHTAGIRATHLTVPGLTEAIANHLRDVLLHREVGCRDADLSNRTADESRRSGDTADESRRSGDTADESP